MQYRRIILALGSVAAGLFLQGCGEAAAAVQDFKNNQVAEFVKSSCNTLVTSTFSTLETAATEQIEAACAKVPNVATAQKACLDAGAAKLQAYEPEKVAWQTKCVGQVNNITSSMLNGTFDYSVVQTAMTNFSATWGEGMKSQLTTQLSASVTQLQTEQGVKAVRLYSLEQRPAPHKVQSNSFYALAGMAAMLTVSFVATWAIKRGQGSAAAGAHDQGLDEELALE